MQRGRNSSLFYAKDQEVENENDGVLVINSSVKNQYAVDGFTDTGLVNGTEYFYMAFPYTEDEIPDLANLREVVREVLAK